MSPLAPRLHDGEGDEEIPMRKVAGHLFGHRGTSRC